MGNGNEVNWKAFDIQTDDRIKVENGKKYELGFCSVRQESIEVVDKEKSAEGKLETKKTIPVLVLGVDFYNGTGTKKELLVSSKRLIQHIRTYFEKDLLFKRIFQLERTGEGYQTMYALIALQDKPAARKSADVEAFA